MSRPGRYVLVSQTAKTKQGQVIEAENKNVAAGIAVGLRCLGLESQDAVALESVFKCQ
jgi:hypothetical protein